MHLTNGEQDEQEQYELMTFEFSGRFLDSSRF